MRTAFRWTAVLALSLFSADIKAQVPTALPPPNFSLPILEPPSEIPPPFSQTASPEKLGPTNPNPATHVVPSLDSAASGELTGTAPHKTYCLYAFADYLYLRAEGADIPYAQPRDGLTPLAVPTGPVAIANSEYATGFRVGGGVAFGDGNFLQGAFTAYHSGASSKVEAPAGSVMTSLLTFPTTPNSSFDSDSASLTSSTNFYLADIDFKHRFWQTENCTMNWIAGARLARLEQQMQANYSITGATTVASNIDFDGAGIRLGLEGEYSMRYGLFIFGRGVANLLAGRFSAIYYQTNVFVGQQASTGLSDTRVVPVLDLETGIGWQTPNQRIRLMAGYYLSAWGNMLTTNGLIQGVQNSNFTTNSNNFRDGIIFDGLMARLELRF